MKKIIFLHMSLGIGGAEKLRLFLLKNIDKKRYNIKVCCLGKKGIIGKEIEKIGYSVDELRQNPSSKNLYITYKLIKYLARERPDILHCSLFNANFHGRIAGFLCRVPHLITEEHSEHYQYNGLKFLPYRITDRILCRVTDFIVCCSEKLRQDIVIKERLPAKKTITIENCIDLANCKVNTDRKEIRNKHGIANELVFIVVASLSGRKGHNFLIESLRKIKDMGYNFKCFFAGDGPLKESLKLKVKGLKLEEEIIFLGNIDNIADYLNASDVFVLPSFSEGLSIALMEAMSMGLASIVTNVGSHAELIKTGFNGTVISSGDAKELEKALVFYSDHRNLIKEFGKRSQCIIKERYSSVSDYVRKYYELWDKCNSNKRQ